MRRSLTTAEPDVWRLRCKNVKVPRLGLEESGRLTREKEATAAKGARHAKECLLIRLSGYISHASESGTTMNDGNDDPRSQWRIAAEAAALEYGRETGLDVVTLNPALVFGPLLQPTVNASSQFLIYLLKGGRDQVRDKLWHIVDVRDVADALLLLYETPGAAGQHICAPHFITVRELLRLLKIMESIYDMDHPAPMTSEKLEKLGWSHRPLRDTIADTIEFCQEAGFLEGIDADDAPCRFPPLFNNI
ncbi:Dihydroflavonol-4-reductase [Triticum urartu]|uniref:Dihydroflavonol-4-reductase n=1 Tax=Triticum urartu TaxID=4572 RepID=M7ZDM2_TRIUA|nr:Dihydroflavonol-4-reductase [Triticum urartu]